MQTIVLGNILGISDEDVVQVAHHLRRSRSSILVARWRDLMLAFFDENQARSGRSSTPLVIKIVFFVLLSACTVAALQTVGAMLVIAMVDHAGRHGLSAHDRPLRTADLSSPSCTRGGHELRRRLCQLLPRRRDRRR
jgi:manganese/iron transport system permease protein